MENKSIYQKLDEARKYIRSSKIEKEGHNDYSRYDYFTPEQVEGLVAKACEETGTLCITSLKADAFGLYQILDFLDINNPEQKISFELRTAEADMTATNRAQKMGGTDTYSERYIKMKAFQIKDNNMDFDSQNNQEKSAIKSVSSTFQPRKTYNRKTLSPEQYQGREVGKDSAEHDAGETIIQL